MSVGDYAFLTWLLALIPVFIGYSILFKINRYEDPYFMSAVCAFLWPLALPAIIIIKSAQLYDRLITRIAGNFEK